MSDQNIFIHIPKTGGTTIYCAINNTEWQGEPDFHYRHIDQKGKKSNSGDIFDFANFEKYRAYNIFMMLRDPVDRVISEYHFLKERKNFMELLQPAPKDFTQYIKNPQTQNGMLNFLVGKRLFSRTPATEKELENVLTAIDAIPIHIGIFEHFAISLSYFSTVTGIDWEKNIPVKRMTFIRPAKEAISKELTELIMEKNQLDQKLYERGLQIFQKNTQDIRNLKVKFDKDKYDHILPYVVQMCLFEFCMDNKKFIQRNHEFFKKMTFYFLNEKKVQDGKTFVASWNKTFLNHLDISFPGSPFVRNLESIYSSKTDPLEQTVTIANATDEFLKENKQDQYYNSMMFNKELAPVVTQAKKGLFSKLFR